MSKDKTLSKDQLGVENHARLAAKYRARYRRNLSGLSSLLRKMQEDDKLFMVQTKHFSVAQDYFMDSIQIELEELAE